jgi:hypothetical protein
LGRIERHWRTLADRAKNFLVFAELLNTFWGVAFLTMVYIHNRSWSSGSKGIPLTLVTGKRPDLGIMRVFGCPKYVHIDASRRKKLGDKAWKGIFVGYAFDFPSCMVGVQPFHKEYTSQSQRRVHRVVEGRSRHLPSASRG